MGWIVTIIVCTILFFAVLSSANHAGRCEQAGQGSTYYGENCRYPDGDTRP
jgi:hypothetical protein